MLKWLAILAVLFAIAQTPVPTPRKATDHAAGTSSSVQQYGGDSKAPSQSTPPLASQNQPTSPNGDAGEQGSQDKGNSVIISKLPSVSILKDWADWSYWAFSGLLACVGALQVWLLWRTLAAISRQSDHMIASERAWIVEDIDFPSTLPSQPTVAGSSPQELYVAFWLQSRGRTVARIRDISLRFHAPSGDLPDVPYYLPKVPEPLRGKDFRKFANLPYREKIAQSVARIKKSIDRPLDVIGINGYILVPDQKIKVGMRLESICLTEAEAIEVRSGNLPLFAYGRVDYETMGTERYTQFCYKWATPDPPRTSVEPRGFVRGGPDSYNDAT